MAVDYKIGIDIGGTHIRFVLVRSHKLIKKLIIKTPRKLKDFNNALNSGVWKITSSGQHKISYVGFSVAGVVSNYTVDFCTNAPYLNGYNFAEALGFSDSRHMSVDNDARSALWYELQNTKYKKGIILMITLGTGVGRALSQNGQVQLIKDFEWAEKWESEYQKIQRRKELGQYLSYKLWELITKYQPRMVIFGGGVVGKRKGLIKEIAQSWRVAGYDGQVCQSKSNDFAGALGAALL